MKILIHSVPFSPAVGGIERIAEDLANQWHLLDHEVTVLTETDGDDENIFPFKVLRTKSKIKKCIEFKKNDIVVYMGFTIFDVLLGSIFAKKNMLTHHGHYIYNKSIKQYFSGGLKRFLSVFFVNVSVSKFISEKISGRHFIINNCYQELYFNTDNSVYRDDNSFIFCGRLVSEKGCDLVLDSFKKCFEEFSDAKLTIIGDGPERIALENKVKILGLSNYVHFMGALSTDKVAEKLKSSKCLIVPSIVEEAFGIVVLEGLGSGCEIIASDRGGLREATNNLAWLIEPDVNSITSAMIEVCNGKSKIDNIKLKKHLKLHLPKKIAAKYLRIMNFITR